LINKIIRTLSGINKASLQWRLQEAVILCGARLFRRLSRLIILETTLVKAKSVVLVIK